MEYIDSTENKKVKEWASLNSKKTRQKLKRFLLESARGIEEGLVYGRQPEAVLLLEDKELPSGIEGRLEGSRIIRLSEKAFMKLAATESTQGIIGVYPFKGEKLGELLDKKLVLFLDGIQDPGNLGTIIRSAAAFDLGGILLGPGCVDLYNEKVLRSTLGGIFALPIFAIGYEDLGLFMKHGFRILGAGLGGRPVSSFTPEGKTIVGIGHENAGLSEEFLKRSDGLLTIPICNQMESLNAGVAASIILYEFNRQ